MPASPAPQPPPACPPPAPRSYNGTLMAYGQTGAGKTYSLSSIAADAIGMIPRAAAEIFSHIAQVCMKGWVGFGGGRLLATRWCCCRNVGQLCIGGAAVHAESDAPAARACNRVVPLLPPQDGTHEYSVYMSYVQLYMELIQAGAGCWRDGGGGRLGLLRLLPTVRGGEGVP